MTGAELADRIDHTLLDAAAASPAIDRLCDEAIEHGFHAVCVHPVRVARCAARLVASRVVVCSVAGFPLGANLPEVKALEARRAAQEGAREVDVVASLASLIAHDASALQREIAAVVEAAAPAAVKVILETARLDREAKVLGARIAVAAGAAFVKTSTGFAGGATPEDVRLLRETVGPIFGVKASGGIRSRAQALAMIGAGADRIGTSSGVSILLGTAGTASAASTEIVP